MANEYAITAASDRVSLDAQRRGQTTFTVSNRTARLLPTRARVVTQLEETSGWFSVLNSERAIPASETQQFAIDITVPASAAEGDYAFRLDVAGIENPDEQHARGPSVIVTVPPPGAGPGRMPWWIFAVAGAVVLLIVIATAVFMITRDTGDDEPVIVEQGQVTLQRSQFYDFDAGLITEDDGADLEVAGSISDNAALRPANGSQFGMVVTARGSFEGCAAVNVSPNTIPIEDVGTDNHLCVRTTDGNLTEALIEAVSTTRSRPPVIVSIRFAYKTFEGD